MFFAIFHTAADLMFIFCAHIPADTKMIMLRVILRNRKSVTLLKHFKIKVIVFNEKPFLKKSQV
jgi:hypothetical protein